MYRSISEMSFSGTEPKYLSGLRTAVVSIEPTQVKIITNNHQNKDYYKDHPHSLLQFGKLMNNHIPRPSFQGCYTGSDCQHTFMFNSPGSRLRNMLEFKSIKFTIEIDDENHHSRVNVTVEWNE